MKIKTLSILSVNFVKQTFQSRFIGKEGFFVILTMHLLVGQFVSSISWSREVVVDNEIAGTIGLWMALLRPTIESFREDALSLMLLFSKLRIFLGLSHISLEGPKGRIPWDKSLGQLAKKASRGDATGPDFNC